MTPAPTGPSGDSSPPDGPESASGGPGRGWTWKRLIAPLRSEDAAFRMVVWAAAAAIALAIVVLTVRALT